MNPWHRPGSYSDLNAGRVCAAIDMMLAGDCWINNTQLGLPSTLVARLKGVPYDEMAIREHYANGGNERLEPSRHQRDPKAIIAEATEKGLI